MTILLLSFSSCGNLSMIVLLSLLLLLLLPSEGQGLGASVEVKIDNNNEDFALFTSPTTIASQSFIRMQKQQSDETQNHRKQQEEKEDPNTHIRHYEIWKSEWIHNKLMEYVDTYKDFVVISTSQDKYGLPAAGEDKDCPFYKEKGCPNYIVELQDYTNFPLGSEASNKLPEVFLSGCLHGNERVGPTSVMEALGLMLESAACEALPKPNGDKQHDAIKCRKTLEEKGIDNAHRKWLARLVSTRRIVIVPTTNALGYYRNIRTEGSIDPNRDFPYDLLDPKLCMQTIAGRTANEIYREHMFQLALTFHAGMEAVGYEWGAPTWLDHYSPDDEAQADIGSAYSRYGGGWSKSKPYQYGTMNDIVYYVRGGMEDWAYAASFDPERVLPCTPTTFGGYPEEKTIYDNSTLRVFNMLIETSDNKEPKKDDLGTSKNVLSRDTSENGHVSRNIRLALLAIELVEPYTSIVGVNQLALSDDIVPLSGEHKRDDRSSCRSSKAVMVAQNVKQVDISWTVGGAITIENTELWYAKWDDIPEDMLDCWNNRHLDSDILQQYFTQGTIYGQSEGAGPFSRAGAHPRPSSSTGTSTEGYDKINFDVTKETNGPIFVGTIDIPDGLQTLDELVVIVSARVDQGWTGRQKNTKPDLPPQSHVVNARTNPDWYHEKPDGKVIQGRLDWFSVPLTVVIGDFTDHVGTTQGGQLVDVVELHPRLGDKNSAGIKGGMKPKSANDTGELPVEILGYLAIVVLLVAICIGICCCIMGRNRRRFDGVGFGGGGNSDDFVFDSKPYSDSSKNNGGYADDNDDGDSYDTDDDDDKGEVELPAIA